MDITFAGLTEILRAPHENTALAAVAFKQLAPSLGDYEFTDGHR
jgi:hypothetical protein